MTASERAPIEGPVYLDASAWVKLYLSEPHSRTLNTTLLGRKDVFVSVSDMSTVVTYDPRLAAAARSVGLAVAMPGVAND